MTKENENAVPTIGFIEATKRGFKNLFNFQGKIGKTEFWWCFLSWMICFVIVLHVSVICSIIGWEVSLDSHNSHFALAITEIIVVLFFLIILMALMHRRLHDTGDNVSWATASVCLLPFALIGLFLVYIFISEPSLSWPNLNEFTKDMKQNWKFSTASILCIISLIAFVPVFIKTLICLLKK